MNTITPITPLKPLTQAETPAQESVPGGTFGAVFQSAIDNVRVTDAANTEAKYLLATGQLDNPAALMIAGAKSQIAVDLLIQLRNKAVEAYNELTRINM